MVSGEFQTNASRHTLNTKHNLLLLKTVHLVLYQSPQPKVDEVIKVKHDGKKLILTCTI